jgi:hypothetical protein
MKTIILFLITVALLSACTKGGAVKSLPSGYTCTCNWNYKPGHDTVVNYKYPGLSLDSAAKACDYERKYWSSIGGIGGGNCALN